MPLLVFIIIKNATNSCIKGAIMLGFKTMLEATDKIPINPDGSVKLPGVQGFIKTIGKDKEDLTLAMYLAYMTGYYGEHKRQLRKGKVGLDIYEVMGQ